MSGHLAEAPPRPPARQHTSAVTGAALSTAHALHWAIVVAGTGALLVLLRPTWEAAPSAASVADLRRRAAQGLLVEDATARARRSLTAPTRAPLLTVAAVAGVAAAWVHALVVRSHLEQSVGIGAFFALLAAAQLAWAVALVARPTRRVLAGGVALQMGVALLWLLSRTTGVPPLGLAVAPVGLWDALATSYELLAAGAALASLRVLPVRRAVDARQRTGMVVAVAVTGALAVTGL